MALAELRGEQGEERQQRDCGAAGGARAYRWWRHQPLLPDAEARRLHQLGMVMEVNMMAVSLRDVIEDDTVPRCEYKKALVALLRSTPPEMHPMLIGRAALRQQERRSRCNIRGTIVCAIHTYGDSGRNSRPLPSGTVSTSVGTVETRVPRAGLPGPTTPSEDFR